MWCDKEKNMIYKTDHYKRTPEWSAAKVSLITGLFAHLYALTNTLHNYDNILQQPKGYGAGITSGRWLLSGLGDFFECVLGMNYNLPAVNGLLYLLVIAISAAFVVNLLQIRNGISAMLVGALMATFPTVCSTLIFRYTSVYYGISLLLAVLAAWVVYRTKIGFLLSALAIACSMGIYQAYVPVTISLFVLVLMRDALKEDADFTALVKKGIWYCVILILGVILYFLLLKFFIAVYSLKREVVLDSYQGISTMGKISLAELPGLLKKAWLSAALVSVRDYCELASTRVLKILWTLLIVGVLLLAVVILYLRKPKPLNVALFCLMGLVFPLAINFIVIMCPDGIIYTIMVYPFVLVACAPLMLIEFIPRDTLQAVFRKGISILAALIIFYNSYNSNFQYSALYYANRQVENYVNSLITQMRMTEGFTPDKDWAFLGTIQDPLLYDIWNHTIPFYGGIVGSTAQGLLNATYSFDFWIYSYIGYGAPYVSQEEKKEIGADPQVKQMPCWPDQGSIRVIDDVVVVKFQDIME